MLTKISIFFFFQEEMNHRYRIDGRFRKKEKKKRFPNISA